MTGYKASKLTGLGPVDFNPHVDFQAVIPEPSSEQIAEYFQGYGDMLRDGASAMERFDLRLREADKADTPEERLDARDKVEQEYRDYSASNVRAQLATRARLLSEVCTAIDDADSRQAFREALLQLPGRVLTDFEGWVQGELTPKAGKSATGSDSRED